MEVAPLPYDSTALVLAAVSPWDAQNKSWSSCGVFAVAVFHEWPVLHRNATPAACHWAGFTGDILHSAAERMPELQGGLHSSLTFPVPGSPGTQGNLGHCIAHYWV